MGDTRINFEIDGEDKYLLSLAAIYRKMTLSEYIRRVMLEDAQEVIKEGPIGLNLGQKEDRNGVQVNAQEEV